MLSVAASLLESLRHYPSPNEYVVAYSGGCDSHVLLHALVQVREQLTCKKIRAIHVDHGLQEAAAQWSRHCESMCHQYNVPCTLETLNLDIPKGESIEAFARKARYRALEKHLQNNSMLLLAQHQDDQAETLLLQLLRGRGVKGLAGMPALVWTGKYWQVRPFLGLQRFEIEAYAEQCNLNWIDDPSNTDTRFDRNFLRNEIIPPLKQRWPSLAETLSRAATHQAEANLLLNDLAELDWQNCRLDEISLLAIEPLQSLSPARQRNLLRYWIAEQCQCPMPDSTQCQRILDEVLPAVPDAEPMVSWGEVVVRRYRNVLHLEQGEDKSAVDWQQAWDLQSPLMLPSGQQLVAKKSRGHGMVVNDTDAPVIVRFRQGGEKCRLPGRTHRHELKKLLQSWGVPPWQRDRIPLIYVGDELAQVVGYSVCEPFLAKNGQMGVEITLNQ